jgi:hypothetical protein
MGGGVHKAERKMRRAGQCAPEGLFTRARRCSHCISAIPIRGIDNLRRVTRDGHNTRELNFARPAAAAEAWAAPAASVTHTPQQREKGSGAKDHLRLTLCAAFAARAVAGDEVRGQRGRGRVRINATYRHLPSALPMQTSCYTRTTRCCVELTNRALDTVPRSKK